MANGQFYLYSFTRDGDRLPFSLLSPLVYISSAGLLLREASCDLCRQQFCAPVSLTKGHRGVDESQSA